jgi:mannose-1-phosphate guanylyltransferase
MNSYQDHSYAVILAGGSGTRLWPMSRDNKPKQFLKLGGTTTLLQQAAGRISRLIPWEKIIVVTNVDYANEVRRQLPQVLPQNIIAEPTKRDTALAMALGSLVAKQYDSQAVVTNIASDHVLKDEMEYQRVITKALELAASDGNLITVGITPTGPNVNFGYIQVEDNKDVNGTDLVCTVRSFKEKPDRETAEGFLHAGNYFWNANMYTWKATAVIEAFHRFMPELTDGLSQIEASIGTDQFESTLAQVYENAPKVSIDVAISEKADNLLLLPGDFGWDDVGLWSTVYELGEKDEHETVAVRDGGDTSPVVAIDAHRNLVSTNGRLVALVGVEDLVVVDSDEVVLILPRERAADVKKVVAKLEEEDLKNYL